MLEHVKRRRSEDHEDDVGHAIASDASEEQISKFTILTPCREGRPDNVRKGQRPKGLELVCASSSTFHEFVQRSSREDKLNSGGATLSCPKAKAHPSQYLVAQDTVADGCAPMFDEKAGPASLSRLGIPTMSLDAIGASRPIAMECEQQSTPNRAIFPSALLSEHMSITHPVIRFLSSIQLQGYAGQFLYVHGIQSMQGLVECVRCEKDVKAILGEHASRQHQIALWRGLQKWVRKTENEAKGQSRSRKTKKIANRDPLAQDSRDSGESSAPKSVKVPRTENFGQSHLGSPQKLCDVEANTSRPTELSLTQLCDALLWEGYTNPNRVSKLGKELNGDNFSAIREGESSDISPYPLCARRMDASVAIVNGSTTTELTIAQERQECPSDFYREPYGSDRAGTYRTLPDLRQMLPSNTTPLEAVDVDAEDLEENRASRARTQLCDDNMEIAKASKALLSSEFFGVAGTWPHSKHADSCSSDSALRPEGESSHFSAFHKSKGVGGRVRGVESDTDTVQLAQEDGVEDNSDSVDSEWGTIVQSLKDKGLGFTGAAPYKDLVELHQIDPICDNSNGDMSSASVQDKLTFKQGPILLDAAKNVSLSDLVNYSLSLSPWRDESDVDPTQEPDQAMHYRVIGSGEHTVSCDGIVSYPYRGVQRTTTVVLDNKLSTLPINLSSGRRECSQEEKKDDFNRMHPQLATSHTRIRYDNSMGADVGRIPCVGRADLMHEAEESIEREAPPAILLLQHQIGEGTLEGVQVHTRLGELQQPKVTLLPGDSMECKGGSAVRAANTVQHERAKSSISLVDSKHRCVCPEHGMGEGCPFDDLLPSEYQVHKLGERLDGCAGTGKNNAMELKTEMDLPPARWGPSTSPKPSAAVFQEIIKTPNVSHFTSYTMEDTSGQAGDRRFNGLPMLSYGCTAVSVNDPTNTESFPSTRGAELAPFLKEGTINSEGMSSETNKTESTACTRATVGTSVRGKEARLLESPGRDPKKGGVEALSDTGDEDVWKQFGLQSIQSSVDVPYAGLQVYPSAEGFSVREEISPSATSPCGGHTATTCQYRVECLQEDRTHGDVDVTVISDSEPRIEDGGTPENPDDSVKFPHRMSEADARGGVPMPLQHRITGHTAQCEEDPALPDTFRGESREPDGTGSTTLALQELVSTYRQDPSLAHLTLTDLRMWCARLGLRQDIHLINSVKERLSMLLSSPCVRCPTPLEEVEGNAGILSDNPPQLPRENASDVTKSASTCWEMIEADELRDRLRLLAVRGYFYHVVAPGCLHRVESVSGLPYKSIRTLDLIAQQERYLLTYEDLECARQQAKEILQEESERCIVASLVGHAVSSLEQRVFHHAKPKNGCELDFCNNDLFAPTPPPFELDPCAAEDSDGLSLYERALILEPVDAEAMTVVVRKDFPFISHNRVQQMLAECDVPLQAVHQPHSSHSVSLDRNTPICSPVFYTHEQPRRHAMHNEGRTKRVDEDRRDDSPLFLAPPASNYLASFTSPQTVLNGTPPFELSSLSPGSPAPLQVSQELRRRENTRRFFALRGRWRGRAGV